MKRQYVFLLFMMLLMGSLICVPIVQAESPSLDQQEQLAKEQMDEGGIPGVFITIENSTHLNRKAGLIALWILGIGLLISLTATYFTVKTCYQHIRRGLKFKSNKRKTIIGVLLSFMLMIGITYSIIQVPKILMNGMSWPALFVWLPESVKWAYYMTLTSLWTSYLYLISKFVIQKQEQNYLLIILGLLSFLSGLGNFLIIYSINVAITSDIGIQALLYFSIGILLYVGGQQVVRKNLIELTNKVIYKKRMEIIDRLLKTSYEDFEKIEGGKIQATLNNDTEVVSRFINIVVTGVTSLATIICCFLYLGYISFYGLILSITIILLIASIYYFAGIYANRVGENARDIENSFFQFIDDLVKGFKELSFYEKRKLEFQSDIREICDDYRVNRGKANIAFANMFVIGELLFTAAIGVIAFLFPIVFTDMETSALTTFIFVLLYMTGPVHGILNTLPDLINVRISWRRINDFLNQLSTLKFMQTGQELELKHEFELIFDGVEYSYGEVVDHAFRVGPIDYQVRSGEVLFITGGNGSGKSTLAKLLTGLYSPTSGEIRLNGKEIHANELSQYCSAIFSDFHLFEKLYGIQCEDRHDEIQKYLKVLQMDHKLHIKNGRFNTIKLSTGQKKRLALLISYLEDKPIYLFDEWAADQDPEFRKFFYQVLIKDLKARGKCVIAITHDDYYFGVADKTLKLELGKVV
ncbi:cyclic peptide export ABC transporter [Polycladospora coralii]|uniref:cyclic peptide export ABC transporter n=1 Tax=Polycladospora coralii TaxID=2771432 RepID=UPI0017470250|nr:cyclic peptide export ABC transporter [Polycladospora coralii]